MQNELEKSTALITGGTVTRLEPGNAEHMPSVLNRQLRSFDEEISDSMNLIDDSAKHLLSAMIAVPKSEDGSDVMTKCEVAKQIASLARVKLDFIKATK